MAQEGDWGDDRDGWSGEGQQPRRQCHTETVDPDQYHGSGRAFTDGGEISLERTVERFPDGIAVLDDERVVHVNETTAQLVGADPDRLEGTTLDTLVERGVINREAVETYRQRRAEIDTSESTRIEVTFNPDDDADTRPADRHETTVLDTDERNASDETFADDQRSTDDETFSDGQRSTDDERLGDDQRSTDDERLADDQRSTDDERLGDGQGSTGDTATEREREPPGASARREETTIEAHVRPLSNGTTVVSLRDVTHHRQMERALEALHETAQAFTAAQEAEEIAAIAADASREIIGPTMNAVYLYDEQRDALVPTAATTKSHRVIGEPPVFTDDDSIAWRVYHEGSPAVYDDVHGEPSRYSEETPVRSEMLFPLGQYGVFLAGSTEPAAFAEWQVSVARVLAADTARALDRATRETELRARQTELERQNDRLDTFASVVSHDLRNPLNVANGNLELARETGNEQRFEAASDALDRAEAIVDDVLTMAREGAAVEDREAVDLGALAQECWTTVATENARLVTRDPPVVTGDRRRLRHVLENLFANSVEHGPDGVTVTIGPVADGFYVADDGPGIPSDERDRVFDIGYSSENDSTGLGLNIVRQMVEAHGWTIDVTAADAGGARFEIIGCELCSE